ncbi:MAG TPA: crossover junction endodeoxyribonuclease RuvC [Opitutaceae bacterium]|nr:crossover junction endodeoxyribonuclease RuvC [Opitutaceae bacterium]
MARRNVRDLWKAKLEGRLPPPAIPATLLRTDARAARPTGAVLPQRTNFAGRVLGIDPSLRGTGLSLVEIANGRQPLVLVSRTLRIPPKHDMAFCLGEIFRAVAAVLRDHAVDHVALEKTIFVQNVATAQILGAARGAAIAAAAIAEKPVFEYPPLRVKQAVVGVGRASKEQMARTVMALVGHGRPLGYDEADATGVALCHAFTWRG